jgi:hypothetical protein
MVYAVAGMPEPLGVCGSSDRAHFALRVLCGASGVRGGGTLSLGRRWPVTAVRRYAALRKGRDRDSRLCTRYWRTRHQTGGSHTGAYSKFVMQVRQRAARRATRLS